MKSGWKTTCLSITQEGFREHVNTARAAARLAVRMKAASVLHSEKYAKQAENLYHKQSRSSSSERSEPDKSEIFLRQIESTLAKNVVRNKRMDVVDEFEVKKNADWEKHINRIISTAIEKCTPNSRVINIPVCKLDVATKK